MRILIILFFLINTNLIIAQEKKVYVVYEITNVSVGTPIYVKAKLFINEKISLYTIDPKDTKYKKNEKAIFNEKDNTVKKITYKSSKNIFFLVTDRHKDSIEQTSGSDSFRFIIKEKIYPFNWVLQNETKLIGKFKCKKATTYFRGRNYIAWYSPEIPINNGPWKFSGLPGLILELKDFNNLFTWKTQTIVYPYQEQIDINIPNESELNKVEIKEYVSLKGQNSENYASIIKSKKPKGSEFTDIKIKRQGIELIYEWEEELDKK
jgi:GLPGLI family protein